MKEKMTTNANTVKANTMNGERMTMLAVIETIKSKIGNHIMSNKYYIAHLKQFDNRESKEKYLSENDAFHITKREVKAILDRYTDRDVVCEDCGKFHSRTDSINVKLSKQREKK